MDKAPPWLALPTATAAANAQAARPAQAQGVRHAARQSARAGVAGGEADAGMRGRQACEKGNSRRAGLGRSNINNNKVLRWITLTTIRSG